ncbi:MAG TPA: NADH-quinone oxidoreductase subunit L [Candidatus Methylacidiphilales bacterium]|nr:NADH-quinone oxidoreductase subunit L [Candidatus Methylacidiphilales bacterium]
MYLADASPIPPGISWFLLLAPLAATVAILLHLHRKPEMAMFASVGSAALCFLIALVVSFDNVPPPAAWTWIAFPGSDSAPGLNIEIGMILDPLAKGMLLIVTGVGLLVHIFSIGYMAHDPGRGRFFGGLSIFMFSMTGIVVATNLIEMFLFWEGVGFSSYLLIGFWYTRDSAAAAANKAFVCNRLADFGFMIGILTFWKMMGTLSVEPDKLAQCYYKNVLPSVHNILGNGQLPNLFAHVGSVEHMGGVIYGQPALLTFMVLGLFAGCVGKSAMFPFHVWLPDAMEGPTPVSALIHAATMVAAGVYMLCRVYPLLILSDFGMDVIAFIGCLTACGAALIAVQQNDIKRILAYSTLSQLGYMVMAVGCRGPAAAMFHLSTHAFFKALLFLAAGSVIHALHEEQDIWKMGGLFKKIPLTAWTFLIGFLALSGFPLLSGFFSKDLILAFAYTHHPFYFWVGSFTAFLTAFYMTRLFVVAFFGPPRTPAAEHPHESPAVMTAPLVILAVFSVVAGWSFGGYGIGNYYHLWAINQLNATGQLLPTGKYIALPELPGFYGWVPSMLVIAGGLTSLWLYWDRSTDPLNIRILAQKFYFDEIYDRSLVGGQQRAANLLSWLDSWILEGLIIRGAAYVTVGIGELLRLFQTGSLQAYAFILSLGGAVVIYLTLFTH